MTSCPSLITCASKLSASGQPVPFKYIIMASPSGGQKINSKPASPYWPFSMVGISFLPTSHLEPCEVRWVTNATLLTLKKKKKRKKNKFCLNEICPQNKIFFQQMHWQIPWCKKDRRRKSLQTHQGLRTNNILAKSTPESAPVPASWILAIKAFYWWAQTECEIIKNQVWEGLTAADWNCQCE